MSECGILEISYNENDKNKGIKEVKCTTQISFIERFGFSNPMTEVIKTKETVIIEIENKIYQFVTVVEGKRGADVEVVEEDDKKYIRTVGNSKVEDNLGELPIF